MKNKIGRYLVIYDGATEEVIELIPLENYKLEDLKHVLDVLPTDPEMHDRYVVGPDEAEVITSFCSKAVEYDFSNKAYFIEAILEDK